MIFKSKYPDIKIPEVGVYQYVTSNPKKISDDKVIFIDGITGKCCTFGEFKHESKKFAAGLQEKLGFKRGDVLAIFSPNLVDYPIVLLGAIAAGGKITTASPIYEETELSCQLIDSGASVLIVHPIILETAIKASIEAKIPSSRVLLFGDKEINGYKPYRSILINDLEIEPVYYTPEEVKTTTAYLPYSSGTVEKPKGIELTHKNIVANLAQGANVDLTLGPDSIIMGILPFCHIYGLNGIINATLIRGATVVVLPTFSLKTYCETIQKYKINHLYAIPPILLSLVNDPSVQQYDLSSVKTALSAAAPLSDELAKNFHEKFKIPVWQAYGLTEASPVVTHSDTTKNTVPGSVGVLIPNVKAKILSEDGRELGYNEPRELWIHGPNVMKSYLNYKEATANVFDKDGFFNTGDVLYVDEQVIDAAVIGHFSEEEKTEVPVAYITIKSEYEQSQALAEEIQHFVNEKVASRKKLSGVKFIDKIPKNEAE
ncbi:7573_t:CDS:10 [Dentiscutata erythropus]|uniref:7573_t:CDS:1 n=1 Tax=Dentiscutata erythropus TaxID=1348616 RepID=A0A9N8ZQC5_9GLOM|nr:7573_t:CDS:10 [Dentiscutata erythropus]